MTKSTLGSRGSLVSHIPRIFVTGSDTGGQGTNPKLPSLGTSSRGLDIAGVRLGFTSEDERGDGHGEGGIEGERDWDERIVCLREVPDGRAPRRRKNKNQHTTQHHDARMMTTVIIAWQPSWRNKLWRVERERIWGTGLDAGGDVTADL